MRLSFVMPNLLTSDGQRLVTGGLERFAWQLLDAARDAGYEVDVHQNASEDWCRTVKKIEIRGHGLARISTIAALESIHQSTDRCVYLSILQEPQAFRPGSLVVSHGVWWDRPGVSAQDHLDLCRKALQLAAEVVSVDYNFLNVMRATFPDLAGKVTVIPNGVDMAQFYPPRSGRSGPPTVLFPRRLDPARGLDLFLAAMEGLLADHDVRITLAVDANDEARTAALRRRVGEGLFAGRVTLRTASFDEMPALYRGADIVAIPSLYSEGTSMSLLEALASGCAVVASDVGGITNVVLNGFNGLLVRPSVPALRSALQELLENPARRRELGQQARRSAAAFDLAQWRLAWVDALHRVYGGP